ncbi:MAG TPA: hypothetical protein VL442_19675 [Mucilaginibacter sp.]|jgi:hypothetical protein|nr:hypothetical protein [Mucilaginibacter sp.]
MKDQIIEVNGQCPTFKQISRPNERTALTSYPDASFWLQIYPPLGDQSTRVSNARMLCPWSMAVELDDTSTLPDRRAQIMDALKSGLKTIRQYDLPPCRIMFAEEYSTRKISVWVD